MQEINSKSIFKIGTRGSALALRQAEIIADGIRSYYPDILLEIVPIKTKGDVNQAISLMKIGGKGVFVKEIEEALLRSEIDIAVHSMKDMPTDLPEGLEIGAVPERDDPRDALIARKGKTIKDFADGALIGTGSLRRQMQVLNIMPTAAMVPVRGNLDTRIKKVENGELDGVIVALSGLQRMGWEERISQIIPLELMLPSGCQGALGIELRKDNNRAREIVYPLNHPDTMVEISAERTFLKHVGGSCHVPVAVYGRRFGQNLILRGLVGKVDGSLMVVDEIKGYWQDWQNLGELLAERVLSQGGRAILDELYVHLHS